MKWIAIAVLLVFMPPILILCYMTIILGGDVYTDKQWEITKGMAIFGGLLEVAVLGVWALMEDMKRWR